MTFFTADDFNEILMSPYDEKIADISNQKLQREAKVVYICDKEIKTLHFAKPVDATHTGILMCIEPLEKPKCEHKVYFDGGKYSSSCLHCGANMKPTGWEVVDEQR